MTAQARHIVVYGRVQGVGFRYFVQRAGRRLALTGDVRNRADGTVEIVVEGESAALSSFIEEVRQGPPASHVDRLQVREIPLSSNYATFMLEGW